MLQSHCKTRGLNQDQNLQQFNQRQDILTINKLLKGDITNLINNTS